MHKTQLHDGEVEVMVLSKEVEADVVIIDDSNAKKHAKYLQLPVTGTLVVLIKARKESYVGELKPSRFGQISGFSSNVSANTDIFLMVSTASPYLAVRPLRPLYTIIEKAHSARP